MPIERMEILSKGDCPICAALVTSSGQIEETEILSCPECQTALVVDRIEGRDLVLSEAPQIEEDWGE